MSAKLYTRFSIGESLQWLAVNDPEYDWKAKNLSRDELHEVIADNLQSFGVKIQAPGMKARFKLTGCDSAR